MDGYTLGALPEHLSALTKFRPADSLDFGRRAKTLAKLMERPLQETQETLARAYGYAHLHELQQVLKSEGSPGPYDDRLFGVLGEADMDAFENLRFCRQERLMRCIDLWQQAEPGWGFENRHTLACDLALFSTAAAHRAASKAVTAYLESGEGYSPEGFPFGFNGALHSHYHCPLPFDENAFQDFEPTRQYGARTNAVFHPQEQLRILRSYRAPHLFMSMVETSSTRDCVEEAEIRPWFETDGDAAAEPLLQSNFDGEIGSYLCDVYGAEHNLEVSDVLRDEVAVVLHEPSDERIAGCAVTRDLVDFRGCLARWRLALRYQTAKAYVEKIFEDDSDEDGDPIVITVERDNQGLFILLREVYAGGEDIQQWSVSATLLRKDVLSGLWTPLGALIGDYIVPTRERRYSGPDSLCSYFDDCGNVELYRVWHLMENLYVHRAGFGSYHQWINEDAGSALANLRPWVAPAYRGTDLLEQLLGDFVAGFQDYCAVSWDASWQHWAKPDDFFDEMEAMDSALPDIGVVFIPLDGTGVLGYSIWEGDADTATGQLLKSNGQQVRLSRWERQMGQKLERKGLGWRMVDVVKSIETDFVFYDSDAQVESSDE